MTSTGGSASGGVHGASGAVAFASADDARALRALLEGREGQTIAITLTIPTDTDTDADVEGHAALQSVALTLHLDEDDTEGHAISVHFPTRDDAARFRRNLLLTGALAGSIVLGSAGAVVISSQPGSPADDVPLVRTPVYERPAGHGLLEGVDPLPAIVTPAAAAPFVTSIDPATGRPADRGFLEGVDGPVPGPADTSTTRPPGRGPLEGVD